MHRLVYLGNAALRQVSTNVKDVHDMRSIVSAMTSIVGEHQGLGLAGPQIGVNKRLFLMVKDLPEDEETPLTYEPIFNPRIVSSSKEMTRDFEGCLSFPGYQGVVARSSDIEVLYTNADGKETHRELSGLHARVFQHELDHLDGVMFLDKCNVNSLIHNDEFTQMDFLQLQLLLLNDDDDDA
ncbi:polypeptide deformylase [Saprolegnia diclina VS20]|uniref:Peptide deformylase n=1 Tax=Saprolegnia diclina (strain VS20) TaxID=1156394 RepID=T0RGY7_SAPDV|nr:polypeptide deformylase [Saprolegnia diclina VS20]EQC31558.1 polypeptide deformylase [Saprolegnia diclina VS20]|eukprot:XP_008614957.1 polypeptide deformylase [Saprolegnia diclina VS20]